jgi:hypothetical protein
MSARAGIVNWNRIDGEIVRAEEQKQCSYRARRSYLEAIGYWYHGNGGQRRSGNLLVAGRRSEGAGEHAPERSGISGLVVATRLKSYQR